MIRFLATWPLTAFLILATVSQAIILPGTKFVADQMPFLLRGAEVAPIGACLLVYFVVPYILTLIRRRCGLTSRRLLWLLPLALGQVLMAHLAAVLVSAAIRGDIATLISPDSLRFEFLAMPVCFWPPVAFGVWFGIYRGDAIANEKFRTGRWETIVPVERPRRDRGSA